METRWGQRFMNLSRLALIADDGRLAGSVQAHLRRHLGRDVPRVALEEARPHLSREHTALWLLAAATPADADRVLRLVQEITLQKLPAELALIEAHPPGPGRGLSALTPYLTHTFRWPDDAAALAA